MMKKVSYLTVVTACLPLLTAGSVMAGEIHVYEGESIQAAIDIASGGDEIMVHPGTYYEAIDFIGKAIWLHSSDGPGVTTIHGNGAVYHVVKCVNEEGPETILEGFTIAGGNANGEDYPDDRGGGIFCDESSPTLTNCLIVGNTARFSGGGVCCAWNSSPTLTNCTIAANGEGGMFCCRSSSPTLNDCTISGNSGDGGLYCDESPLTLTNCTISDNTADSSGGGLYCYGSSLTLTNCTISDNTADSSGGGVYCDGDSFLTLTDCTISGNEAPAGGGLRCVWYSGPALTNCAITENEASESGGGGVSCTESSPTLTNCTITGNTAQGSGGGMLCMAWSDSTLTNCTIAGNTAEVGGGVYCWGSYPTLTNCTITGNTAQDSGGGVLCSDWSDPTLTNCILWDDSPQEIYVESGGPIVTYCDVQGGYEGEGNIDADPLFVYPAGGDHHLGPGSPCIDAGANNALPADSLDLDEDGDTAERLPLDLDGNPRFADDADTEDTGCGAPVVVDMGAYEFQGDAWHPMLIGDIDGNGAVNTTDLLVLLAAWGEYEDDCVLADLDFSGEVNTADLLTLLANWG